MVGGRRTWNGRGTVAVLLLYGITTHVHGQDGGIELFAGETLFFQGTRVSVAHLYRQETSLYDGSDRISDPRSQRFEEHREVLGLNYGLRANITLAALVPVVQRKLRFTEGGRRQSIRTSGFADVALIGKYRFFTWDAPRRSVNASWVAGVELPTGDTNDRDNGARISPNLQLGSGSFDPFIALAATADRERWRFDAQALYKLNTKGSQRYDAEDESSLQVASSYRFVHQKYPGPSHSARVAVVWRHRSQARRGGDTVQNSGSDEVLVRPGLTFHPTPAWDIVLNLDLPVYRRYRGIQRGLDFRTFAAVGVRF